MHAKACFGSHGYSPARYIGGSLLVVLIDEVKFIFYSVLVGKGARFRVLWLARLLAGSLFVGVS